MYLKLKSNSKDPYGNSIILACDSILELHLFEQNYFNTAHLELF